MDDDGGAGVDFTELQTAIDAAGDGDTLLIHPGSYSSATIDNQALTLVGAPGDLALPFVSPSATASYLPLLGGPFHLGAAPLQVLTATVGAGGVASLSVAVGPVPGPVQSAFLQGLFVSIQGSLHLGAPTALTFLAG